MNRQYARADTVRQYADNMLNSIADPDARRAGGKDSDGYRLLYLRRD